VKSASASVEQRSSLRLSGPRRRIKRLGIESLARLQRVHRIPRCALRSSTASYRISCMSPLARGRTLQVAVLRGLPFTR
jgi:hypothetical protein